MKWEIGNKAIIENDGIAASVIIWGIPPEPPEELDKYFGIVVADDIYDEFGNILFQAGQSFNAHYSEMKKPEEYAPIHISTIFCWCSPELEFSDPKTENQVWVHKEVQGSALSGDWG